MKRIFKCLVAAVLVVAMCFSFVGCGSDKIIVQTNAYFAPFEYFNGDKIVGVDVDIMNKVGERLDKEVEFKNGDFGQIIDIINKGKVADVGAAGITITEERAEKVDFSIPYYTSVQYVIWKATDNSLTTSKASDGNTDIILWSQLAGKKIGVQRDTTGDIYVNVEINDINDEDYYDDTYQGALQGTNTKNDCVRYDDAQVAVSALSSGLINCVVVDKLPAEYIVNSNSSYKCAALYYDASTATEESYAMCVTPGNEELLTAINQVLTEMKADVVGGKNAIERLIEQHLGLN